MKTDYSYCLVETECIHRRGCKRWIGNYDIEDRMNLYGHKRSSFMDFKDCIPDYSNVDCKNDFAFLDRFRLSTGEDFER